MYLARCPIARFSSSGAIFRISTPLRYSARWKHSDPKHYFTDPSTNEAKQPPTFFHDQHYNTQQQQQQQQQQISTEDIATAVGESFRKHKRRRQRIIYSALVTAIVGVTFGYSICYKVLYKKEESFIPLMPSQKWHKLSEYDSQRINIEEMKALGKIRCLSILTNHEMIRDEFGVPLKTSKGEVPTVKAFDVWCEDQDPGIQGIVMRPLARRLSKTDTSRERDYHLWHTIPGFLQWRIGTKPINIKNSFNAMLKSLGLNTGDLLEVINPNAEYGEFKHEYPLRKGNRYDVLEDRPMHIWFFGEIDLSEDALIVFKGKYHVNVRMEQVDLLRKENGQLVRYVLYKRENDNET